jgi:gamma-glutamyltranspeptidase/glutathione hydrolase
MSTDCTRRDVLRMAGAGLAALTVREGASAPAGGGCVTGQPEGARAGREVLAAGGNAVDAIVTAALVAGVVAPQMCGPGGYGGHLVIGRPGKGAVAIDFNTAAPQAATADLFPLESNGQVCGRVNEVGWLASGVPGTLAGLQLALDRYGTWPFRRAVQPALRYAAEGFTISAGVAAATVGMRAALLRDPASARLLLVNGQSLKRGSRLRNPDLARMLEALARDNAVEAFYRGDIAQRIAAAFQRGGGLVTTDDLAAYHAREVEPLRLDWRGYSIFTAPLTAGGLTVLQTLAALDELQWKACDPCDPRTAHLRVEALRLAWHDRLRHLGDPHHAPVPVAHLLSAATARRAAQRVREAVRLGRPLPTEADGRSAGGTIHLSAADVAGTMVALTLTHGNSFGAVVTVDGLGLTLGHGMSRFDPRPDHPNAPGPRKRPLHNMCPTVVFQGREPVLAAGARGGRRIPNAVLEVLAGFVGRQLSVDKAVAAPRMHTEGGLEVTLERGWPEAEAAYLRRVGFQVIRGPSATIDAVSRDPSSGALRTASR